MAQEVNINIPRIKGFRRRRYISYPPEDECSDISPIPAKTPVAKYSLPTVDSPQKQSSSFRSISAQVLAHQIKHPSSFLNIIIIDCRYPFEYYGGHIKGAINIYLIDDLQKYFYDETGVRSTLEGLIPIFYCEYSQMRGPTMAKGLRNVDIHYNRDNLAAIDFPEIYLLDKGYNSFWADEQLKHLCHPQSYISMHTRVYRHALKQYDQHKRSQSVGGMRRSKKNLLNVFSDEKLVVNEMKTLIITNQQNDEPVELRTPRTRLKFE